VVVSDGSADDDEATVEYQSTHPPPGDGPVKAKVRGAVRNGARAARRQRQGNAPARRHRHVVKLTDNQERALTGRAERANMTPVRFLVESALAAEVGLTWEERRQWLTALMGIQRVVAGIGNNTNQVAKILNSDGDSDYDLAAVAANAYRVLSRVDEAVETIAAWSPVSERGGSS
jgi:hypothetical protein